MKILNLLLLFILIAPGLSAKEYKASFFGIKSNGITNNTSSIQKAIDYISKQGGGTLVFYVGRYLTGTVYLKSRVYIELKEGAVVVGATSPYSYNGPDGSNAIIVAEGKTHVGVYGKGVVEGSSLLERNSRELLNAGFITDEIKPSLISFTECTDVKIRGVHLWNNPYMALRLIDCKIVKIKGIDIYGKGLPTSGGIFLKGSKWVALKDMFIKVKRAPLVTNGNLHLVIKNSVTSAGRDLSKNADKVLFLEWDF